MIKNFPMSNLTRPDRPLPLALQQAVDEARQYVKASVPESTQRAYATDWATFCEWCRGHGVNSLPARPEAVAAFAADRARTVRPSTIRRALAAIAKMHKIADQPNPCEKEPVPATIKGIERTAGTAVKGKAPANLDTVERLVCAFPLTTMEGLRNRALVLLGFAGAFRRSELVGVDVSHLAWSDDGVVVNVPHSKTDQRGEGRTKPIPFVSGTSCAATALKAWLVAAGIKDGPVFRPLSRDSTLRDHAMSPQSVALIIKAACGKAGLDPAAYSGHSLRSGHVTEARSRGLSDADVMAVTGHKRIETLNIYDRRGNPFSKTSAGGVLSPKKES